MGREDSASSSGSSVRGPTSRAESNGEKGTSLSPRLRRLVGWNSNCLPRAASKLAQRTKTGSDIDADYPRLRREFQRLRADLRYGDRKVPEMEEVWMPF
ncbi:MAG: hypothetical protein A2X89_11030 [Deltaproteobacteria bacterium GWD2_55_8]|nr:MAG: hypothetical protein A2X89_11030 [Deltaproteobacteria bacterium GWD2_55_8]